jgi:chromosome segregation ATPase
MSEHNYAGLAFRATLEKNPDVFTPITDGFINLLEQQQAARRAKDNKAKPPEPVQAEYKRLRSQLFTLQQNVQSTEQKVTNEAGTAQLLEERIDAALKSKKGCEDAGNLRGARSYEHQIQGFETELADVRERHTTNQRYSTTAARELRTWQTENGGRLKQLQKQIASIPHKDGDAHAKELEKEFNTKR